MAKLDNPWLGCQEEDIHRDSQHQDVVGHLATEHKVVFKIEGNLALNIIEQVGHLLCCCCALLTPNYITGVDSMDKCPDCKAKLETGAGDLEQGYHEETPQPVHGVHLKPVWTPWIHKA